MFLIIIQKYFFLYITKSSKIQRNNLASSLLILKGRLKEGDNNILCIIDLWLIINLDTLFELLFS